VTADPVQPGAVRYYYVDEAGDPTLFASRGGRVIAGTRDGCSRFFILGKLDVPDPEALADALTALRKQLLADPYFKGVPSMDPQRSRTALHFHAKDDPGEVRREVFRLLDGFDVRFYAHIRDKQVIAQKVLEHNKQKPRYRYRPNHLYDRCIGPLFENRLHQHQSYRIVFARRGSSDRSEALSRGLQQARDRFRSKWGIEGTSPIEVVCSSPASVVCLQAADYFLWALQRCYERGDRRYIDLLWQKVGLIVDRDDDRRSGAGAYYKRAQPLPDDVRTAVTAPAGNDDEVSA
jgi:hypothetical protein